MNTFHIRFEPPISRRMKNTSKVKNSQYPELSVPALLPHFPLLLTLDVDRH